jgi:glycosyltransferase 2 family protein
MSSNPEAAEAASNRFTRLHLAGILLTLGGLALFFYFIWSVGVGEILKGIGQIGVAGFALILFVYFCRILSRSFALKLSVPGPYTLSMRDCGEAVIIGEALSALIPLGVVISGTAKAVVLRRKVPLVVAFASVATENLFFSLGAALLIISGAAAFLAGFELNDGWKITLDVVIALVSAAVVLGLVMVIRQWHWASGICELLYGKGFFPRFLENARTQIRSFEDLIFGFYRRYPGRFVPIFLLQVVFHSLGIFEIWFILTRITGTLASVYSAFMLESINRIILVVFKLIPFVIGVDEAGARFVTKGLALGAGIGVTLSIVRKGRVLFWTAVGIVFILRRGLSFTDIRSLGRESVSGESNDAATEV